MKEVAIKLFTCHVISKHILIFGHVFLQHLRDITCLIPASHQNHMFIFSDRTLRVSLYIRISKYWSQIEWFQLIWNEFTVELPAV